MTTDYQEYEVSTESLSEFTPSPTSTVTTTYLTTKSGAKTKLTTSTTHKTTITSPHITVGTIKSNKTDLKLNATKQTTLINSNTTQRTSIKPQNITRETIKSTKTSVLTNSTKASKTTMSSYSIVSNKTNSTTNPTLFTKVNLTSLSSKTKVTSSLSRNSTTLMPVNVTYPVEIISECPKNFENYCFNSGECYLKSFKSELTDQAWVMQKKQYINAFALALIMLIQCKL